MKRTFALLACLALVFATGACGNEHDHDHPHPHEKPDPKDNAPAQPPEGFANANCPIMGNPIDTEIDAAPWKEGKKVGFCCPGCIDKWNELSEADKVAKLAQ